MRILAGGLFLILAAAAWGVPGGGDDDIAAVKEKMQALLDEATLLEQNGHRDEAARAREQAAELKRKIEAAGKGGERRDDPLVQALHNLEKAIGALDKAGYERMSGELRETADKLRAEIKRRGAEHGPDDASAAAEFWGRNMDTLRIALKGLAEARKADAAEAMERAIHAREMILKGRTDPEAQEFTRKGPDDARVAEFLLLAGQCWREFKALDKAEACEELGRVLRKRFEERQRGDDAVRRKVEDEQRDGRRPGPEDRMARVEERLDRMERMLHEALERLEQRERAAK